MIPDSINIKFFAALVSGCIFFSSCENKLEDVQGINAKSIGKDVAKNVVIRYSVNGIKKSVLKSPLMYRVLDTSSYVEFPNSLHVDFYNEHTDSLESRLDAKYAKYKDNQSQVFLKDSVRVINIYGDTLYCQELYWDRARLNQEFYTDKAVRIRRKMQIIDGIGMDARQDFKEWHILKPIGFIVVPNTEFPN